MGSCQSVDLTAIQEQKNQNRSKLYKTSSSLASTGSVHLTPITDTGLYGVEITCAPSLRDAPIDSRNSLGFGITGLENLGNTCFLNTALQCLAATTPLSVYFLCYDWKSEINRNNPVGSGGQLVYAYARLLKQIWTRQQSCVSPTRMYDEITSFCPEFQGYGQHDAQEALAFLLDGIHEDLNRVEVKPFVENLKCNQEDQDELMAAAAWRNYLLRNKSVIVDLFQGQLKSTLTCLSCEIKSIQFEPFMFLSLPIDPKDSSIERSLELFTTEEEIEWFCNSCQSVQIAEKKLDLWKLPSVLIIHLKRFEFDAETGLNRKLQQPIRYPTHKMNLSPFLSTYQVEKAKYNLFAMANHHGTVQSGHYTSIVRNSLNQQWYHISDDQVDPIGLSQVVENPDAYVLFYSRTSIEKASLVRRQSISMPQNWPHSPSVTQGHY